MGLSSARADLTFASDGHLLVGWSLLRLHVAVDDRSAWSKGNGLLLRNLLLWLQLLLLLLLLNHWAGSLRCVGSGGGEEKVEFGYENETWTELKTCRLTWTASVCSDYAV